ncbi:hypothetical protein CRENBAI_010204, partial [Crenichthys baileyi]
MEEIRATDIQSPPRAQEPQENHRRDYRNLPREEQGEFRGNHQSAEAPGSCSDEHTPTLLHGTLRRTNASPTNRQGTEAKNRDPREFKRSREGRKASPSTCTPRPSMSGSVMDS